MVETRSGVGALRVAHVGRYSSESADGVSTSMSLLTEALSRDGVTAEVWEFADVPEVSKRVENNVEIFQLPSSISARTLHKLAPATRSFLDRRRFEVDLLHLHSVFIPRNVWLAREAGLPYVVSPHGGYTGGVLNGRKRTLKALWMRLEERRYVEGARAIHAVSRNEAIELAAMFPEASIECVPNGVDMPASDRASGWTGSGPRRLLFLGRIAVEHKGLDLLVEGFALYLRDGGQGRLVIAGPDFRGGRAKIEGLAGTLGIEDHIEFPGEVFGARKDALLQESFALVHTSRWDGMPLSVLEALGAGCPPLVTPHTNLGAEVERHRAGIVVQPDPASIAAGLKELLSLSEEDYELMRKKGRELVQEHSTWASAAETLGRLYGSIAAAQGSAA